MKFSGQKFLILLGMFLIPLLFVGALLREPVVNRGLLRITLSLLKKRMGAALKAQTWKVDLSKFAVAVEGIEFKHKKLIISAKEVRAEISPLFLLVGRVYFSKVWANEVKVLGEINLPDPKTDKTFHLEKDLNEAADQMIKIQDLMDEKKIGFELIEISALKANTNQIKIENGDLNIENYGYGHVKTEFSLEKIRGGTRVPSIERLQASVVLYKDRSNAYLSIRKLNAELQNKEYLHTTLETKGRIPGDVAVDFISDLTELKKWMRQQPIKEIRDFGNNNTFGGYLEIRGSSQLQGAGLKQAEITVKGRSLVFEEFSLADLQSTVQMKDKEWKVAKIKGRFHGTRLDKKVKNEFTGSDIILENARVAGQLQFDRLGLCAVLRGVGVPECNVDLVINGKIDLSGTMKPLKIIPRADIRTEPFEVFTDPDTVEKAASSRLLKAKPGHVTGSAEIRDTELEFIDTQVTFGNTTVAQARGTIKYKPTRVFLRFNSDNADLSELMDDFLTLKPKGLAKIDLTVDYDIRRSKDFGRTDFFMDYLIRGLEVSDIPLGDASGKLHFLKKIVEFKPTLRMGPGTLKVAGQIGKLDPSSDESQMSIYAEASDYEILVPRKQGSPVFDGVFNFETHLKGSLADNSSKPFGGRVKASLHSMMSFGIPFDRGEMNSYVDLNGIKIESLTAYKGDTKTQLSGFLGPRNSRLDFSSEYVPIRQLGYEPDFERLAQSGDLKINGYWDQNKGYAIEGQTRDLKIGTVAFPVLSLQFEGDKDDEFFANVNAGDDIRFRYDSKNESFQGKLKDSGIFLGLTLINRWERIPDFLKVKGDMDISWAKTSGQIDLKDLDIQVTDRWSQDDRQLIKLDNPTKIIYQDGNIRGNATFSSGFGKFDMRGNAGELVAKGKLSLRLFDLFLPDFIRLVDGAADVRVVWNPKTYNLLANASVKDATAYMPVLGAELRGISGNVVYAKEKIIFESLTGRSGDSGDFTLNGDMAVNASTMNLRSHLSSVNLRIGRDFDLQVSGDFTLSGKEQPFLLAGKARVDKGLLRKEFSGGGIKTAILDKPFLNFDIPFEVGNGFQVRNSLTDSYVTGRGYLSGNELSPLISGRFDVVKGNLLAKDTEFAINFARVNLPRDSTIDPINVNVQASTLKNYQGIDYRIFLSAEGDPNDLKLNFRSEPSLSQRELIALLTLGYVPQEQPLGGSSQGGTIAQSASAEAFQLLFGQALGKGIQKQTGFDVRVGTSANLKQEDTIPKVSVYRKLGERVSATFGRSLDVARPENNFKIDYRLLKNLNLTGVWENPEENRHSLGLDLRLEFEIK